MDQHGISKLDLKRQNRMQVLKILKQNGPTSRIDIAGMLELTRAAVTIITNEMIEQGIISEIGEYKHLTEKAPRGRKKILIDINHNYKFALGVTVENDIISVGLCTLSGDVLDKRNMALTPKSKRDDLINFAITSIKEILSYNCLNSNHILGIGIGILPSVFELLNIPVENKVADYSKLYKLCQSHTNLPVIIDNSVKGTAMANIDFQRVKDTKRYNIAFLQFGDDFHFVVTNLNDPIISYDNRTDFVNKLIVNPNAEISYKKDAFAGSVASELSPEGLVKKIQSFYGKDTTPLLYEMSKGDKSQMDFQTLIKCIDDELVRKELVEARRLIAVLINNLVYSTNPQKLVIQYFSKDIDLLDKIIPEIEKIAGTEVSKHIDRSIIDPKNRFLSGCALAIRELFFTRGGFDYTSVG